MPPFEIEEEEFTTQISGHTIARILGLAKTHRPWLVGFIVFIAITSAFDSYFTYLGKQIIDEGILADDWAAIIRIATTYSLLILVQAASVFGFIYLAGILGERIQYDLRKKSFNHLQDLSLA